MKSGKEPSQLNPKQTVQAGNGNEAELESGDKSSQSDSADGKKSQQMTAENMTKSVSETTVANKPELVTQATEGEKDTK